MSEFRGYFYIENVGLTDAQRAILVEQLKLLGLRNDSLYPNERNHWAIRPDNNAVIFEAVFDTDKLSAVAIQTRLATIFGVSITKITYTINQTIYGPLVTYSYLTLPKLRMGVFAGLSATWEESHDAALLYLSDFKDVWGDVEIP